MKKRKREEGAEGEGGGEREKEGIQEKEKKKKSKRKVKFLLIFSHSMVRIIESGCQPVRVLFPTELFKLPPFFIFT